MSVNVSLVESDSPGVSLFYNGPNLADLQEEEMLREQEREDQERRCAIAEEMRTGDFDDEFSYYCGSDDDERASFNDSGDSGRQVFGPSAGTETGAPRSYNALTKLEDVVACFIKNTSVKQLQGSGCHQARSESHTLTSLDSSTYGESTTDKSHCLSINVANHGATDSNHNNVREGQGHVASDSDDLFLELPSSYHTKQNGVPAAENQQWPQSYADGRYQQFPNSLVISGSNQASPSLGSKCSQHNFVPAVSGQSVNTVKDVSSTKVEEEWMMQIQNPLLTMLPHSDQNTGHPHFQYHQAQQQHWPTVGHGSSGFKNSSSLGVANKEQHSGTNEEMLSTSQPLLPTKTLSVPTTSPSSVHAGRFQTTRNNKVPDAGDAQSRQYKVHYKKPGLDHVGEEQYYLDNENVEYFLKDGPEKQRTYEQLEILYRARGREIEQLTQVMKEKEEDRGKEIRKLKHKLALANGEAGEMKESLQQSQKLLQQAKSENTDCVGRIRALESQVVSLMEAKEELIKKHQVAEATIENMSHHIEELQNCDSLSRARNDHEAIVSSLTSRYQNELQSMNKKLSVSRATLEDKQEELGQVKKQLADTTRDLEQAQLSRGETINRLARSLEDSQGQCQALLEKSSSHEMSVLKVQLQQAVASKRISEDLCANFESEVKELKEQLSMLESASSLGVFGISSHATKASSHDDSMIDLGIRKTLNFDSPQSADRHERIQASGELVASLRSELEKCLYSNKQKRSQLADKAAEIHSLTNEIKEARDLIVVLEKTCQDQKNRLQEVDSVSGSSDGVRVIEARLMRDIEDLKVEKDVLLRDIEDYKNRLQEVGDSEAKLAEINAELSNQISQMVSNFDVDKRIALESCQRTMEEVSKMSFDKLRQEIEERFHSEKTMLVGQYQEKIHCLKQELASTQSKLDSVKSIYSQVCEESAKQEELLTERFRKTLEEELGKTKDKLEAEKREWEACMRADMEKKHSGLKESLRRVESELREASEREVQVKVSQARQACMEEQRQIWQAVVDETKRELQEMHQKDLHLFNQERSSYDTKLALLNQQICELRLGQESARDMPAECVKEQEQAQLSSLEKQHEEEMNKLIEQYHKERSAVEEKLNEMCLRFSPSEDKIRSDLSSPRIHFNETGSYLTAGILGKLSVLEVLLDEKSIWLKELEKMEAGLGGAGTDWKEGVLNCLRTNGREDMGCVDNKNRHGEEKSRGTRLGFTPSDSSLVDGFQSAETEANHDKMKEHVHKLEFMLNSMKQTYESQVDQVKQQQHKDLVKAARLREDKFQAELRYFLKEKDDQCKAKLEKAERQYEATAKLELENVLTKTEEKYKLEMERLVCECEQKVKVESLKVTEEFEERRVREQFEREMDKMKVEHETTVNSLRHELNLGKSELESNKRSLESLKRESEADKFIAEQLKKETEKMKVSLRDAQGMTEERQERRAKWFEEAQDYIKKEIKEGVEGKMKEAQQGGFEKTVQERVQKEVKMCKEMLERKMGEEASRKVETEVESLKRKFVSELEARVLKEKSRLEEEVRIWREEAKRRMEQEKNKAVKMLQSDSERRLQEQRRNLEEDMKEELREMMEEMTKKIQMEREEWEREKEEYANKTEETVGALRERLQLEMEARTKACIERDNAVDLLKSNEKTFCEDKRKLAAGLQKCQGDLEETKMEHRALVEKYGEIDRRYKADMKEARQRRDEDLAQLRTQLEKEKEELASSYKLYIMMRQKEIDAAVEKARRAADRGKSYLPEKAHRHMDTSSLLAQHQGPCSSPVLELRDQYLEAVARIEENANMQAAATISKQIQSQRLRVIEVFTAHVKAQIRSALLREVSEEIISSLEDSIDLLSQHLASVILCFSKTDHMEDQPSSSNCLTCSSKSCPQSFENADPNLGSVGRDHKVAAQTIPADEVQPGSRNNPDPMFELPVLDKVGKQKTSLETQSPSHHQHFPQNLEQNRTLHPQLDNVYLFDSDTFHPSPVNSSNSSPANGTNFRSELRYTATKHHVAMPDMPSLSTPTISPRTEATVSKTKPDLKPNARFDKVHSPRDDMKVMEARVRLANWAKSGQMPWKSSQRHQDADGFVKPGQEAEQWLMGQRASNRHINHSHKYELSYVSTSSNESDDASSTATNISFLTLEPEVVENSGLKCLSLGTSVGHPHSSWTVTAVTGCNRDNLERKVELDGSPQIKHPEYNNQHLYHNVGSHQDSSQPPAHQQVQTYSTTTLSTSSPLVKMAKGPKDLKSLREGSSSSSRQWKTIGKIHLQPGTVLNSNHDPGQGHGNHVSCQSRAHSPQLDSKFRKSSRSRSAERNSENLILKSVDFSSNLSRITQESGSEQTQLWRYKSLEDLLPNLERSGREREMINNVKLAGRSERGMSPVNNERTDMLPLEASWKRNVDCVNQRGYMHAPVMAMTSQFWEQQNEIDTHEQTDSSQQHQAVFSTVETKAAYRKETKPGSKPYDNKNSPMRHKASRRNQTQSSDYKVSFDTQTDRKAVKDWDTHVHSGSRFKHNSGMGGNQRAQGKQSMHNLSDTISSIYVRRSLEEQQPLQYLQDPSQPKDARYSKMTRSLSDQSLHTIHHDSGQSPGQGQITDLMDNLASSYMTSRSNFDLRPFHSDEQF